MLSAYIGYCNESASLETFNNCKKRSNVASFLKVCLICVGCAHVVWCGVVIGVVAVV